MLAYIRATSDDGTPQWSCLVAVAASTLVTRLAGAPELLDHRRHEGVAVHDDAEPRGREDRRVRVGVDGDDRLRAADAGEVLARTRDAEREVDVGADGLAGEPHLPVGRRPARIDRRQRGSDGAAEQGGQLLQL